jgi:hypothetical protein
MTVGGLSAWQSLLPGRCFCLAGLRWARAPTRRAGVSPQVIHRPENSAGLRCGFDAESAGTLWFRSRPVSYLSPTVSSRWAQVRFVRVRFGLDLRAIACPPFDRLFGAGHRTTGRYCVGICWDHQGARHWLIFSFSVRARALRFRPGSRPSGFCSRACLASPCHCAARLAARCTSGSPMTPGSAPPANPAMEISCGRPARRS